MTASTELVASVEIAHEARIERVPSGAADGPVLRVIPGDAVRVAVLLGRDPQLARAMAFGALAGGASLVALVGTHDGRSFLERAELLRDAHPDLVVALAPDRRDVDGVVELAEALRFGCAAIYRKPPTMVFTVAAVRVKLPAVLPEEDCCDPEYHHTHGSVEGRHFHRDTWRRVDETDHDQCRADCREGNQVLPV